MFLLTLRDLQYRAMRFGLVIVGTSVIFAMLLLMNGISEHFKREPEYTVNAIGADWWVIPAGISGPFTAHATLDPSIAPSLGARRADPVIVSRGALYIDGKPEDVFVVGHGIGMLGAPPVAVGAPVAAQGQLLADATLGLQSGDRARFGSASFAVVGVTHDTTIFAGLPVVFMSIEDVRVQLFKGASVATAILTSGRPREIPRDLQVMSKDDVVVDSRRPMERATGSITLVQTLLWIVSAMIIGGVVFLSSMERRRDFAVLKAVGGSTRGLLAGLAAQSVFVALGAAALASLVQLALAPTFPIKVEVSSRALVQLPMIAVGVALLASVAGMRRVARTDPALAFSGPGG